MTPAVHFVGFKGEEYHAAVRLWGRPDFIHRRWDVRAQQEIAPGDTIIFARWDDERPPEHPSYNDSATIYGTNGPFPAAD